MRVRLRTRAIVVYTSTMGLLVLCCWYLLHKNNQKTVPKVRSFDHIAVDRVMLAHEQKVGLWMPEAKPVLNLFPDYDKNAEESPRLKVKVAVDTKQVLDVQKAKKPLTPIEKLTHLSKGNLSSLSYADLASLYHSYAETIQLKCLDVVRLGRVTDGGWEVCNDEQYKPKSPCLVYSFGIANDFSFDDATARRYKCEVHSFDPSMKTADYQRRSQVWFHAKGLADYNGASDKGWKMGTLTAIKNELGHAKKTLDILKLDIEEWEWKVLPEVLASGILNNVQQFLLELHGCETCSYYNPELTDKEPTKARYIQALNLFKDIYNLGFRIFWTHKNMACRYLSRFGMLERTACHELHMVKIR